MPKLIGLVKDSVGAVVTGYLTVKLNAPMIDVSTTPDSVLYSKEMTYKVINGDLANVQDLTGAAIAAGIVLLPSNEPTYTFSFEYEVTTLELYLSGVLYTGDYHKDGANYFTGAVHSGVESALTPYNRITKVPLFEPFNASIPTGTNVEWASLQHSSINTSNLDSAAYYIASLVATKYGSALAINIAVPKGNYNGATQYVQFDVVYDAVGNGVYWYINAVPGTGIPLTDTTRWMKIGQMSTGGSGLQPSDVLLDAAYSSANWQAVNGKAPVASRLFTQMELYAKLAGTPVFTDNARGIKQAAGNNTDNFATTSFVRQEINAITPAPATTANDLPALDNDTTLIVNSGSLKRVIRRYTLLGETRSSGTAGGIAPNTGFNTRQINAYLENSYPGEVIADFGGVYFTLFANARYWIEAEACVCGVGMHRLYLCQNNSPTFTQLKAGRNHHTGLQGYQASVLPNDWANVQGEIITGGSNLQVVLRHYISDRGINEDFGKASGIGTELYSWVKITRYD